MPRADQGDGLVALASIVSKTVRELWMDEFNAYWLRRIPDLRPTAGYPSDAVRFRQAIEDVALAERHDPAHWWRSSERVLERVDYAGGRHRRWVGTSRCSP